MPHISPRPVSKKVLDQIYKVLFITATSRLISKAKQERFFHELLTPTEKIMLGKRLAAIVLLEKGLNPHTVGKALQLSPTTTTKLQNKIEKGACKNIIAVYALHKKGAVTRYLEQLLSPLPRYGISPSKLLNDKIDGHR